jgi:glycosyltransferase involved in cell wall biosynthesis
MSRECPEVSVIVPVYNAAGALPRLVASLRAQDYPRDRFEIILVDNNSTDGSGDVIRGFRDVVGLSQTKWQGPGATRNVGIEKASGEMLAFIDADCWAHPKWLGTGVRALVDGGLDRVAGHVEFVLSPYPNIYEIYDAAINFRQTDFVSGGWCGTGNLFTPKSLFDDIGLFDPALISCEDTEFGMRASRAEKSLGFAPDAVVYHYARTSLWSLVKKWIRTEYGAAQVWKRHGLLELHLWSKKANYRPLRGVWRSFPPEVRKSARGRLAVDGIANILRTAGNLGSFLGDIRTSGRKGAR